MNSTPLIVLGLMLTATLIGVGSLYDHASEKLASAESAAPLRCPASVPEVKTIIGHSEVIQLGENRELTFDAKVDSGAQTSSIHAIDIQTTLKKVTEHGETKELLFVSFETVDDAGKKTRLERMVSRVDQVRSASGVSTRYFFREKVWFHNDSYEVEINLADRSHLSKKMLIGKNLIEQGYIIDATKAYVVSRAISTEPEKI
ncbi:MAG: RimK/LysX family protein [Bacteriovoracia bacterium]